MGTALGRIHQDSHALANNPNHPPANLYDVAGREASVLAPPEPKNVGF